MSIQPRSPYRVRAALLVLALSTGCAVTRPTGAWRGLPPDAALARSSWTLIPQAEEWPSSPAEPRGYVFQRQRGSHETVFSVDHPRVDDFVSTFQSDLRGFLQRALLRSGRYLPRMAAIMEEEGVPPELAYLPLIESGFRPEAVSRAGAVGPWQLIRGTGRRYGLRIDRYVDERRDPVKSTRAAARYLRDLYAMFGNWELSLAAYNTGEARIARILERHQVDDFWDMMEGGYLQRETRDFVPQFLAALQIARAPEAHGFDESDAEPVRYDLVRVDRSLPLRTVAKLAGAPVEEVSGLNPQLVRGVTPPDREGYRVRVPKGTGERFELAYSRMVQEARQFQAQRSPAPRSAGEPYRVRRGDTPSLIAKRLGVPVRSLMAANGWKNPRRLQIGQVVRVPAMQLRDAVKERPVRVAANKARKGRAN